MNAWRKPVVVSGSAYLICVRIDLVRERRLSRCRAKSVVGWPQVLWPFCSDFGNLATTANRSQSCPRGKFPESVSARVQRAGARDRGPCCPLRVQRARRHAQPPKARRQRLARPHQGVRRARPAVQRVLLPAPLQAYSSLNVSTKTTKGFRDSVGTVPALLSSRFLRSRRRPRKSRIPVIAPKAARQVSSSLDHPGTMPTRPVQRIPRPVRRLKKGRGRRPPGGVQEEGSPCPQSAGTCVDSLAEPGGRHVGPRFESRQR